MDSFDGCFYPRYTPYPNMDQFVIQDPKDPNTVAFLSVSHDQKVATAIVLSPNPFQLTMTIEKSLARPTSPVHVHVDDDTPVHVHVKKPGVKKTKPSDTRLGEPKPASKVGSSNLRRSASASGKGRSRSKSPTRGPWVPPPAKTTTGNKYAWQGASHRLEISTPQDSQEPLGQDHDLDTEDEDRVQGKMKKYEDKIDCLMNEVGTLKSEVELQKTMRDVDQRADILESSRRVLEEQEYEIQDYRRELQATEKENLMLRKSMDLLKEDANLTRTQREQLGWERDHLMKKLIEVEMDGQAAAKQVTSLKELMRGLIQEKRVSETDSVHLARQKELLVERLADFEATNRALRRMLRERHEEEAAGGRLAEQRDLLLRKLSETEERVQSLRSENLDKERVLMDLKMQTDAQKEENMAMSGMQSSLETTKAHLQKQLRQKEGDCNRMAVQIRSLESQLAQERIDVDHLQELLRQAKDKAEKDKEALKKATRVQKQRATKSEDALENVSVQLLEKDNVMAEMRAEVDNYRARCEKLNKEKVQSESETLSMRTRIRELEGILERLEDDSKSKVENSSLRLQEKTAEVARFTLENDQLKNTVCSLEERLAQEEAEISTLKSNLRQYETLVDEYRSQMNRSRREADETLIQLEDQKRETARIQKESEQEIDKVKSRLQARLQDLEPIPELLKTTELKLQDGNAKLMMYERKNAENTRLIGDLTAKVEKQADNLDQSRDKFKQELAEKKSLEARMEAVDRRLHDLEAQNRDLLHTIAKREEALHQANMRLDERGRENATLSRQLEQAMSDTRRQSEHIREKSAVKERTTASRILDMESQLSQARAEIARVKREKEEAERKFNSRLYDLKDRLEQSHSTNRSMQNYVQFLKNSYANVFGDTSLATSSPLRGPSTFQ